MDHDITFTCNGEQRTIAAEPRQLLVHALREQCELTSVHVGCDTANCGACSVYLDGHLVKSCTLLAVQAEGHEVTTTEGTTNSPTHCRLRESLHAHGAVQCGYCTPGMVMTGAYLIDHTSARSREDVAHGLKGNLCMCTGYMQIIDAITDVAQEDNS